MNSWQIQQLLAKARADAEAALIERVYEEGFQEGVRRGRIDVFVSDVTAKQILDEKGGDAKSNPSYSEAKEALEPAPPRPSGGAVDPHPEDAHRTFPILVAAAMIIRDGMVLLERRAPSGIGGSENMWDLPGGKVECGETPKEAVVREIREELGITVSPVRLIPELKCSVWPYRDSVRHWIVAAYECEIVSGEPKCGEELQWFRLDALPEDWILRADLELLKRIWSY